MSYQGWEHQQGTNIHHATAFATGDPSIFSLEGIDFNAMVENPMGEIEVSLGTQMPFTFDPQAAESFANFAQMFENFDYNQSLDFLQGDDNATGSLDPSSRAVSAHHATTPAYYTNAPETPMPRVSSATPQFNSLMSPATSPPFYNDDGAQASTSRATSISSYPTPQDHSQSVHTSYGQDAFQQYFNLDAQEPVETTPSRHVSANMYPQQQEMQQYMAHDTQRTSPPQQQQAQYAPPMGAAHVGSRRVGASWKPPRPEPDSPIDHSPTETWTYPVLARS